jgi:hypothetical protein
MVRTFSEPAIRGVDDEADVTVDGPEPRGDRPVESLPQQVERLRRVIDELAAVVNDID